jgi:hypothetical protein
VLKRTLTLSFDQKPDYEGTINALKTCLQKSLIAQKPGCPPSNYKSKIYQHEFEWNRSIASQARSEILEQEHSADSDFFKMMDQSFSVGPPDGVSLRSFSSSKSFMYNIEEINQDR